MTQSPRLSDPDIRSVVVDGVKVGEYMRGSYGYLLLEAMERITGDAVAAERERCARIAEEFDDYGGGGYISDFASGHDYAATGIAARIREVPDA